MSKLRRQTILIALGVVVAAFALIAGVERATAPVDPQGGRWVATKTTVLDAQDVPEGEDSWVILPDSSIGLFLGSEASVGRRVESLELSGDGTLEVTLSGEATGSGASRWVVSAPLGHSSGEVTKVEVKGAGEVQHLEDQVPEEDIDPGMSVTPDAQAAGASEVAETSAE